MGSLRSIEVVDRGQWIKNARAWLAQLRDPAVLTPLEREVLRRAGEAHVDHLLIVIEELEVELQYLWGLRRELAKPADPQATKEIDPKDEPESTE